MEENTPASMKPWIAFAVDAEGVHCYHFTAATSTKEHALARFNRIVRENDWVPFDEVNVHMMPDMPQHHTFDKVAFYPFPK